MTQANEDIKWLYGKLKAKGYNIGTEQEFTSSLSNQEDRDWYYQKATDMGLDVGSKDDFEGIFAPATTSTLQVQADSQEYHKSQADISRGADDSVRVYQSGRNFNVSLGDVQRRGGFNAMDGVDTTAPLMVYMTSPDGALHHVPAGQVGEKNGQGWRLRKGASENRSGLGPVTKREGKRLPGWDEGEAFLGLRGLDDNLREKHERELRELPAVPRTFSPSEVQNQEREAIVRNSDVRLDAIAGAGRDALERRAEYIGHEESIGNRPVKEAPRLNVVTGEVEQSYLLPNGGVSNNEALAELDAYKYRRRVDNMTIAGQMRSEQERLEELTRKRRELKSRLKDSPEKAEGLVTGIFYNKAQSDYYKVDGNQDIRSLDLAIRQSEERLGKLKRLSDDAGGKDVGFWRGLDDIVTDLRTWDMGIVDSRDSGAKLAINRKLESGQALSEAEEMAMESLEANQNTADVDNFWFRAGVMTGEMLPFMLDFAMMGGSRSGGNALSRWLYRAAINKAPSIARKGVSKWTVKVLGTMPGDLLRSTVMTNTVQAGKTASDIASRKLGDVVVDETGNYAFENEKSWAGAIWQGEANAVIENYSEMFGTHLEGVLSLKSAENVAGILGAKRLSGLLAKANSSELGMIAGTMQKHLNQLGVSDYFGEVGEEYYGQLWRTMLNLDDAYKQNPDGTRTNLLLDGQFHGDIWGGMALSMGLMGAGKYSASAAQYGAMKHRVNRADKKASVLMNPEAWEALRARIDETPNDEIGYLAVSISLDNSIKKQAKEAVMEYIETSLNFRGFNLGSMAHQRGNEVSQEEADANQSYMDGYSATTAEEMNRLHLRMERERERLVASLGEDVAAEFDKDDVGALARTYDPELRETAIDYVNARRAYDGMIQRQRDDIDSRVTQSDAMIESRRNSGSGMIHPATMKLNDRKVYIVNGNVTMFEDGSGIDHEKSDKSLIIQDAETGELSYADPSQVLGVDEAIDVEAEKEMSREQIRLQYGQKAVDNINGVLSFNPGDTYTMLGADGQPMEVTVIGPAVDEEGNQVKGAVSVQYPDGSVIQLSTENVQQSVDEYRRQEVEAFAAEREGDGAEAPKLEQNNQEPGADGALDGNHGALAQDGADGHAVEPTQDELAGDVTVPAQVETEQPVQSVTVRSEHSALSLMPRNVNGEPIYEQAEPNVAWDALVEQSEGDEEIAAEIADDMVAEYEKAHRAAVKALDKVKEGKPQTKKGEGVPTMAERIAAKKIAKSNLAVAQQDVERAKSALDKWKDIAGERARRVEAIENERKARELTEIERVKDSILNVDSNPATFFDYFGGSLQELINKARESATGLIKKIIAPVSERLRSDLYAKGIDIDDSYKHVIDNNAIRHAIKNHSGKNEDKRGQIPITDEDFHRLDDVVANYDSVDVDSGKRGNDNIIYSKTYSDGTTIFVEEKRVGRKELAAVTMWKKKNPALTDANRTYAMPISDLDGMSLASQGEPKTDSKDSILLANNQNIQGQEGLGEGASSVSSTGEPGAHNETLTDNGQDSHVEEGVVYGFDKVESLFARYNANDETAELADRVFSVARGLGLEVYFDSNLQSAGVHNKDNSIGFNLALFTDVDKRRLGTQKLARTLLHEVIHAVTDYAVMESYSDAPKMSDDLLAGAMAIRDIYDAIKDDSNFKGSYGITDIYEMTAELSSPSFRMKLKSKKLWGKLVEGVMRLFGISKEDGLATNAYESLREAFDVLLNSFDKGLYDLTNHVQSRAESLSGQIAAEESEANPGPTETKDRLIDWDEPGPEENPFLNFKPTEVEAQKEPTEAQKKAGNYKMKHVRIDGYDISIENEKGSIRRGKDANGTEWESEMRNDYGYIRGTEGVDGDHIDVFLSDTPEQGDVFVVDQYNPDGSFDEHKVMYGFADSKTAMDAYLSNYEEGWGKTRRIDVTGISKDEFKKWIKSSKRKTKPFADYSFANKNATNPSASDAGTAESQIQQIPKNIPNSGNAASIISAEDRAKLSEDEQAALDDFLSRYNSAPIAVIAGTEDIKAIEVGDDIRANLREAYGDEDCAALYMNVDGKIYIFAGRNDGTPLQEVLAHENTHAVEAMLGESCIDFLESFMGNVSVLPNYKGAFRNLRNELETVYPTEKIPVEFLAYVMQAVEKRPRILDVISKNLDSETLKYFDNNIISNLYGIRRQERLSRVQRTVGEKDYGGLRGGVQGRERGGSSEDIGGSGGFDAGSEVAEYLGEERLTENGAEAPEHEQNNEGKDSSVGTQVEDLTASDDRAQFLSEKEYIDSQLNKAYESIKNTGISKEDWEQSEDWEDEFNKASDGYSEYIRLLGESGELQRMYDNVALGDRIKIRNGIDTAGFNLADYVDTTKEREAAKRRRDEKRRLKTAETMKAIGITPRMQIGNAEESNKAVYEVAKGLLEAAGIRVHEVSGEEAQAILCNSVDASNGRKQFSIRTYHGTGADFDAFDFSHMGEGEGAQAYGWGGYVTEVKGIGKAYASNIAGSTILPKIEKAKDNIRQVKSWLKDNQDWDKYERKALRHLRELQKELKAAERDSNDSDINFYQGLIELQERNLNKESHSALIDEKLGQIDGYEREVKALEDELSKSRHLYTVKIPSDTGVNYLDWDARVSDEQKQMIGTQAVREGVEFDFFGDKLDAYTYFEKMGADGVGFQTYRALIRSLGSDKAASEFLSRAGLAGIKYAADHNNGGRADGKKNYVVFKEEDMKISNHIRFLRAGDEVYGWTVGGEVYLNKDAMNPETPMHEYTHLWDALVRRENPALWERGKELMAQTPVWNEVVNDPNYTDIAGDEDAVASEVHARLTGKEGARILSDMVDDARKDGAMAVAERVSLVGSIKRWLKDMFSSLKRTLGEWNGRDLESLTIEDFNRMPLRDLAEGINPGNHTEGSQLHAAMSSSGRDFDTIRDRAIKENGIVMPGLSEKEVRVVDVPRHDFNGEKPIAQARKWAKSNIVGEHELTDSNGVAVVYTISGKAIDKYLSSSAIDKSENLGVHLSVLKMLPEVISKSIEAEAHPDYNKGADGVRAVENGYKSGALVHRFYGAVIMNGIIYRIKTTIIEDGVTETKKPHSYEVTTVELSEESAGQKWSERYGTASILSRNSETSSEGSRAVPGKTIRATKLLKGVEKSYDKGVKLLDVSDKAVEDDVLYRSGNGLSADEAGMVNDPVSWALGRSVRSRKQREAYAGRMRKLMAERVASLADKMHLDNIEVVEDASTLEGKRAMSRGFYSRSTGKITIVLPNHINTMDVEQTLLHEAVAHYGLRKLFGEHFDAFLDNVYRSAEEGVRREIVEMAKEHDWNFRTATEEYLASLAEDIDFERARESAGWWSRIKRLFLDMLDKIGFEDFRENTGVVLTDNELRYILWRSYENLAEPGKWRSILGEAADVVMQNKLKVGNYAVAGQEASQVAEDDLFRGVPISDADKVICRDYYERMCASGKHQFVEAMQDHMHSLETLYKSILGKNLNIEDVADSENAYVKENLMSSSNKALQDEYFIRYMRPLIKAISEIAGSSEGKRRELTDYMMAKHGLERNVKLAERDAEAAAEKGADYTTSYTENRKRDYSGLTALTDEADVVAAENVARKMVADYEAAHDVSRLWGCTHMATTAILDRLYMGGLLSRQRRSDICDMFDFYIPLRGWEDTTADEVYGYLTSHDGPMSGAVRAEGRSSKADDPIATIAAMADAAISQSNRNIMKQRFLNFVQSHPSDLVSVSEMWLEKDTSTGEWKPKLAEFKDGDTPEDIERKTREHDEAMAKAHEADPSRIKRGRDAVNIPYVITSKNLNEHQVLVQRNGRTVVLTINGNPRAAQALNGLTNPDVKGKGSVQKVFELGAAVNRELSALYTTRNPSFVASNFTRDLLFANTMAWVKESPAYAVRYMYNYARVNPTTMGYLFRKWEDGSIDIVGKSGAEPGLEKMFYDFMRYGGETGYTLVKDVEAHKKSVRGELRKESSLARKGWKELGTQFERVNRSVENCARFAAFVTSREMGRSMERSVYDAKEISVNFNRKGAGDKFLGAEGQTWLGNTGAFFSGLGRALYVFWNAAVQGMAMVGKAGKRHPVKVPIGAAMMFTLGYVVPWMCSGSGDDDEEGNGYYDLPEYVRRSNFCFKAGGRWGTIPLPVEYRAVYGLGELAYGVMSGRERMSDFDLGLALAGQVSQLLPIDVLEGGGGFSTFVPSWLKPVWEVHTNESWSGLPIYRDSDYDRNKPLSERAYKSTDKDIVSLSRWVNELGGGDKYTRSDLDVISPEVVEYLLKGYGGGLYSTASQLKKLAESGMGKRDFDWRYVPIANRFVRTGDERTHFKKVHDDYAAYMEEYGKTSKRLRGYDGDSRKGVFDMAEKLSFLYNSPEYVRYEIFDMTKKTIKDYRDISKDERVDDETRARFSVMADEAEAAAVRALRNPMEFLKERGYDEAEVRRARNERLKKEYEKLERRSRKRLERATLTQSRE